MNITTSYLHDRTFYLLRDYEFTEEAASEFSAHVANYVASTFGITRDACKSLAQSVYAALIPDTQFEYSEEETLFTATLQEWFSLGSFMKSAANKAAQIGAGVKKSVVAGAQKVKTNYQANLGKMTGRLSANGKVIVGATPAKATFGQKLKAATGIGAGNTNVFKGAGTRMSQGYTVGSRTVAANQIHAANIAKETAAHNAANQAKKVHEQVTARGENNSDSGNALRSAQAAAVNASKTVNAGIKSVNNQTGEVKLKRNQLVGKPQVSPKPVPSNTPKPTPNPAPNQPQTPTQPQKPTHTPDTRTVQERAEARGIGKHYEGGANGINFQGRKDTKAGTLGRFGAGFKNSQGNFMGISTNDNIGTNMKNIGNWAMANKAQATTMAAGTLGAGYLAYRALRSPRPVVVNNGQQQQPVVVNNYQR